MTQRGSRGALEESLRVFAAIALGRAVRCRQEENEAPLLSCDSRYLTEQTVYDLVAPLCRG